MAEKKITVGIVLGSDSDLPVMRQAAAVLEELGVGCEVVIASAHRTPEKAASYAKEAEGRGLEVIIAAAGKAAHLPGVLASWTALPVVGVPMGTPDLGGQDSLYSIVQMPPGIPVATMAIDGAKNAGIFAAQVLSRKYPEVREALGVFREEMARQVEKKAERLASLGIEQYLKENAKK